MSSIFLIKLVFYQITANEVLDMSPQLKFVPSGPLSGFNLEMLDGRDK